MVGSPESGGDFVLSYFLYSTLGCHLCDEAKALLSALEADAAKVWEEVDIASDPVLVETYGIRIPVLRHSASGDELCWPFSADDLRAFLGR